ncbi:MAG: dihydrodipicolinate synthase family protein [bacterium]|nr:dihydrodipicolinate synthase family protein [bacterium]
MSRLFYAIAPTLFTEDGRLDAGAVAANVERAVSGGVSRFLLTGAYGEFQSLTDAERVRVVAAVRELAPRIEIMAGAVHPSTQATLLLAKRLFAAGADEVMVGPPSMAEVTDTDVLRHFQFLAARAEGSLAVYNNPIFGHDLEPGLVGRLAELGSYTSIKQGTPSMGYLLVSISAARSGSGSLRVLAASDLSALVSLAAGVDGLTSTNYWAFPEAITSMAAHAATSNHAQANAIHRALTPYFDSVRALGQPRAIKAAMTLRSYAGTSMVRLPYEPLSEVETRHLKEVVAGVDETLAGLGHLGSQTS